MHELFEKYLIYFILELFAGDVSVEIPGHTFGSHEGEYLSVVLVRQAEKSGEQSHGWWLAEATPVATEG